jgi:hypothetical protein
VQQQKELCIEDPNRLSRSRQLPGETHMDVYSPCITQRPGQREMFLASRCLQPRICMTAAHAAHVRMP